MNSQQKNKNDIICELINYKNIFENVLPQITRLFQEEILNLDLDSLMYLYTHIEYVNKLLCLEITPNHFFSYTPDVRIALLGLQNPNNRDLYLVNFIKQLAINNRDDLLGYVMMLYIFYNIFRFPFEDILKFDSKILELVSEYDYNIKSFKLKYAFSILFHSRYLTFGNFFMCYNNGIIMKLLIFSDDVSNLYNDVRIYRYFTSLINEYNNNVEEDYEIVI